MKEPGLRPGHQLGRAPAKVNLSLAVLGRRRDGFHELDTVVVRIGLADRLSVAPASGAGGDRLEIEGSPELAVEGNLVLGAAALLRGRRDPRESPLPPLAYRLEKRIPVAAGLGGGSSDAALALRLAAAAWRIGLADRERMELAAALGSDVPFFATGAPAARLAGRGEQLTTLPQPPDVGFVLVTPPFQLATARVFAHHAALPAGRRRPRNSEAALAELLRTGGSATELVALAPQLRDANDLWPAARACEPALVAVRAGLEAETGRPWLLSGSGPTLFAVYPSTAEAVAGAAGLRRSIGSGLEDAAIHPTGRAGSDEAWRSA